jgi:transcriptional regulator with XRE-family HTH domain
MKNKDINVCTRLGEERKRLHLNQHKVATYCEVSVKTIGRWEKNIPIPADKLALLVKLGYDITYILTGVKLAPQAAGLEAASNIWNISDNDASVKQESGSFSAEQARWLSMLDNLAGGDRERLKLIGLALVGYSQATTDK